MRIARELIVPAGAAATGAAGTNTLGMSNLGNTAGTTGVIAGTALRYLFAGGNNVTLSQSINGSTATLTIVGATLTNSSMTVSDAATSGTLARLAFTNLNGITLSLSSGAGGSHTIVGSYTVPTVTNSSMTVSDAATSGTLARLAFTNLNGVTLSLSSGAGGSHTIVGSHNALTSQSTQYHAITLGGNTSGTTTFHATDNRTIWLNGGNNITLSGNGSTITISQQLPYQRIFLPFPNNATIQGNWGNGLGKMHPFYVPNPVTASQINQYVSVTVSSSSNSSHAGVMSFSVGIYSLNASSWSLASSGSQSFQFSNTSNNSMSLISGVRRVTVPVNVNMTPGYWALMIWSQTSTTNANWFTASNILANGQLSAWQGLFGAASSASVQFLPGNGFINAGASFASAMPATVHSSNVAGQAAGVGLAPYADFQIDAY